MRCCQRGILLPMGPEIQLSTHPDGRLRVHPETRRALRAWLAENHRQRDAIWLVQWKTKTGRPRLGYEDVVEELLCFGWIDSTAGALDDEREMVLISPRKRGSAKKPVSTSRNVVERCTVPPGPGLRQTSV